MNEETQIIHENREQKPAFQFYELELVEKYQEFDSIYTFRFHPLQPFNFEAGQWIHLGRPAGNRDKTFIRHMSFASAPSDHLVDFTMDLASGTPYKQMMAELKAGDVLKAFKINGQFHLEPETDKEIVFLCGGIGITPARSIIRELQHQASPLKWTLCHVARGKFLYEDELIAYKNKQLRTNREGLENLWDVVTGKPAGTRYFIAGSDRFVQAMKEKLLASGKTENEIVTESFH